MGEPDIGELFRILTRIEAEMRNLLHRDVYLADREVQVVKYAGLDRRVEELENDQSKTAERAAAFRAQVIVALMVFALGLVSTLVLTVVRGG